MSDAPENIWPDTLKIRDCKIYDDLGGSGKRIYTTAGNGYERKEYTRSDISQARIEKLEAALRDVCQAVAWKEYGECRGWSDSLKPLVEGLLQARAALKETP
jgi:hypothetical protein